MVTEVYLMKLTITKSKNSEQFYIQHSVVKNGKSTTRTFKKLGSLNSLMASLNTDRDGVIQWAKQQVRIETENYKKDNDHIIVSLSPQSLIPVNQQNSFNAGYLFLQDICSTLRIDNICRNIKSRHQFKFNLHSILSDLIYTRILDPSSKRSSYEYAKKLLDQPNYELHDVYRSLSILASESDYIQSELYKNSFFHTNRNTKVLYYDCTNYYFEIEAEDGNRKYGKSKENRPNPIVSMGLFMDGDGCPLAFDIYPGNQNEQLSLKPLEEKIIRDFSIGEFIYCSDSGLASIGNKLFNGIQGRHYVITQSLKKMKKEDRDIALNPKQYRKIGSKSFINLEDLDESNPEVFESVYYKEIPVKHNSISETIIVTYSPKYAAYQRKIRNEQIARAEKMISSNGKFKRNRNNPNDPTRFIKKLSVTDNGEIAQTTLCALDEEKINEESIYDGFYAVSTDIDTDISEIISINKRRWQIEECFRIMKTEFKARPVFVRKDECIKAHFLICFISLLVYRILEKKLNYKYTVEEIIKTLRTMNITRIDEVGYIPSFTRTSLTDALHNLVDFRLDTQVIPKSKVRKIISSTKEK